MPKELGESIFDFRDLRPEFFIDNNTESRGHLLSISKATALSGHLPNIIYLFPTQILKDDIFISLSEGGEGDQALK